MMDGIDDWLSKGNIEPVGSTYVEPSTKEIEEIESLIAGTLPKVYKEFIRKYGCSRFAGIASVECISQKRRLPINLFLGGGDAKNPKSLLRAVKIYRGRMPDEVFPFADDPFGNQYCMVFSGSSVGKIFFWDHEEEVDTDDYLDEGLEVPDDLFYHNMTLVAEDLKAFFRQVDVRRDGTLED